MEQIHVQFWPCVIGGLIVLAVGMVFYAIFGSKKDVHLCDEGMEDHIIGCRRVELDEYEDAIAEINEN